jgi:two-component system copper resistance phosphate regulon response regulator CusR
MKIPKPKILVIEDEPGIARFIRDGLEEENFSVTVCSTGEQGLQNFHDQSFDLLLIDWMLPGISGLDVCRAIRSEGNSTPVIFLTARDTVQDVITGLETGAQDYIRKPFAFDELLARIHVQTRVKPGANDLLQAGEISINRASRSVFIGETAVNLTQREYDLLEYLVMNKGKICDRSKIMADVWDIHHEQESSSLDVYINFLRKKLKQGPDGLIQTVRGVGFIIQDTK